MDWSNKDPREAINKRDDIVILRPDHKGLMTHVGTARVDFRHIFTSFNDIKHIDANMKWDNLWWWIRIPIVNNHPCPICGASNVSFSGCDCDISSS